jgi:CcmD family protein
MATFVAGCLVAWLGVFCYLLRLGALQHRLERDAHALQLRLDELQAPAPPASKAA